MSTESEMDLFSLSFIKWLKFASYTIFKQPYVPWPTLACHYCLSVCLSVCICFFMGPNVVIHIKGRFADSCNWGRPVLHRVSTIGFIGSYHISKTKIRFAQSGTIPPERLSFPYAFVSEPWKHVWGCSSTRDFGFLMASLCPTTF